ncbi:MAG: helix-turn-helix domain-containing protein [Candidatus Hodarchaeales archaeon]|jgi:predicted ArsR family transcriptional regulator
MFGPLDPAQILILEALQTSEFTISQIADRLQIPVEEAATHLEGLKKDHLVYIRQTEGDLPEDERHYRASAIKVVKSKSAAKLLLHPIASQILNLLSRQMDNDDEKKRALSLSEIAKELDLPKSKINYHITRLMEDGLILKTRTESFRGLVRPFYRAKWKVNLPHLQSLRQKKSDRPDRVAEIAYLESVKFFLWGWLLGKGYSTREITDVLALHGLDDEMSSAYSHSRLLIKIADVLEQLAAREEDFALSGSPPSDELRFELLQRATKQVLEGLAISKDPQEP